ncbi:MAG: alanine racemase [Campylobacterota bacterium]|nr:alanine racemase [Campylobacterota bacterium]
MGYIKLNKEAFFDNLDYFSSLCTKDKLCIALKDNAYGHGIYEVASMCSEYGIKHVFVRDLNEAEIVKEFEFESLLVLYEIPKVRDDSLIVAINSLEDLHVIPNGSKIELKIDTGMNRNGIVVDEVDDATNLIVKKELVLNGIFTHFCCADEDNSITKEQEELFLTTIAKVKSRVSSTCRVHCANTHGVFKVDMSRYDLARVGIGAYGYIYFENIKNLKPVLSLHANKITTKNVTKGEHIGYGSSSFIASNNMIISNYDVGYGDGFIRLDENKCATIADGRAILGRVSMDSLFVEGSDEEICIFNDVKRLSIVHSTITYEILTILNSNIKRFIVAH